MLYNAVLVPTIQQRESAIHIRIHIYGECPLALLGQRVRYQSSLLCVVGPDMRPGPGPPPWSLWSSHFGGLHTLLLLLCPSPVSCSILPALRRHLFMSLRNKSNHVLFLVGLKCPAKEKFLAKGVGRWPNTQGDHGGRGAGSHWQEVRATLLRPHGP